MWVIIELYCNVNLAVIKMYVETLSWCLEVFHYTWRGPPMNFHEVAKSMTVCLCVCVWNIEDSLRPVAPFTNMD